MEKEPKMGVDPKIKEEINKEGWEEDAAVLIGKKEEMAELLEKLESEGKTADLGTYLKLHKEIILPHEEILDEKLREEIKNNKGNFLLSTGSTPERYSYCLRYIDKDGDASDVNILAKKITELSKKIDEVESENKNLENVQREEMRQIIIKKLEDIGFMPEKYSNIWGKIYSSLNDYKERLEEKSKTVKKEEFDF